ncbi:hypothetical protein B0H13DRAFT_1872324 [Mycena leptocephala]|nr:hypothetical protein B0H13DRAFT_1872324 [Mycena leptocephala]
MIASFLAASLREERGLKIRELNSTGRRIIIPFASVWRQDATRLGAGLSNQPDMVELDGRDNRGQQMTECRSRTLNSRARNVIIYSIESGPSGGDGFCGFFPGFGLAGVLDSSVLGTYTGRWIVEFGESTQPYAPVDPESGCGPEPFNMTTRDNM